MNIAMRHSIVRGLLLLACLAAPLHVGCQDDPEEPDPGESSGGEEIEEDLEEFGDDVSESVDDAEDEVDEEI